jgi:hypothetical protein
MWERHGRFGTAAAIASGGLQHDVSVFSRPKHLMLKCSHTRLINGPVQHAIMITHQLANHLLNRLTLAAQHTLYPM